MKTEHVLLCICFLGILALTPGCQSTLNTAYRPSYTTTYSKTHNVPVAIAFVADKRSTKPTVYYQDSSSGDTGQFDRPAADIVRQALVTELQKSGITLTGEATATAIVTCEILDLRAAITEPLLRSPTLDLAVALHFDWKDTQTKAVLGTNEQSERRSRKLGFGNKPSLPFDQGVVRDYGNELINDMLPRIIEKELNSISFLAVPQAPTPRAATPPDSAPPSRTRHNIEPQNLNDSLSELLGHANEGDAKRALVDITEARDIVDLIDERKIEVQTQGSGMESVRVRVRRLVPYALTVRIPVGSYFTSASHSSQNMVTTAEGIVRLTTHDWQSVSSCAACANRSRDIPSAKDSFTVQRSPHQADLAKLMPVLNRAEVDSATRQAAVWIVSDDADYDDLGTLVVSYGGFGFGGSRAIQEAEAARAMMICEQAGIDITRKAIWRGRQALLNGLKDENLKKWLEKRR